MKMEINGLDDLKKQLEDMQKNLKDMESEKVHLTELLNPNFMKKYTSFVNFDEMIELGGFEFENPEDFDEISESEEWDDYVLDNTQFKDWDEMIKTAASERVSNKLGFN